MYYEKLADIDGYAYFVKSGENSVGELTHEIICHPHFHKSREFLCCTHGTIPVIIGGEKIMMQEGDIVFVDSFEVHSYGCGTDSEAYILVLGSNFFEIFDKKFINKRFPRLMNDRDENKKIIDFLKEWKSHYRKDMYKEEFYSIFVNCNRLFLNLMEVYEIEDKIALPSKVHIVDILQYIDEHSREDIGAETVARHFGISKEYFSKIINSYLGENFRTYLNNLRLSKFLQLREQVGKEETVVKLAMDVGFNSEATFYRVYRNYLNDNKEI